MKSHALPRRALAPVVLGCALALLLAAPGDRALGVVADQQAGSVTDAPALTAAAKKAAARTKAARRAAAAAKSRQQARAQVRQRRLVTATARANAAMRARCLRQADTRAERRACRTITLVMRTKGQTPPSRTPSSGTTIPTTRHEVICHRGTGKHAKWTAIAPAKPHDRAGTHDDDFAVDAEYPKGATWREVKKAVDAKCDDEAAKPKIMPAAPTMADICGTKDDTFTIPRTPGVAYLVNGTRSDPGTFSGAGTVVITAVLATTKTGKTVKAVLIGTTSWTFVFTNAPCGTPLVKVKPPAPTVTPVCGPNNDVVSTPTVTGVTYTVGQWVDNRIVVTATAQPGYTFGSEIPNWVFVDEAVPCPTKPTPIATAAPTVAELCGPNNDTVTVPTIAGITYTVGPWVDNVLTVTAVAQQGYVLSGPATWTIRDAATPCPVVQAPEPIVAKIAIVKRVKATSAAKTPVTFTIAVTNPSTVPATNVVVRDYIPVGMVLVSTPAGATISKGVVTWRVGDLAPGATATVAIRMRLVSNRTTKRCNTATAVGDNAAVVVGVGCTRFVRVAGVSRLPVAG